jgi:hypothetical protein
MYGPPRVLLAESLLDVGARGGRFQAHGPTSGDRLINADSFGRCVRLAMMIGEKE